MGRKTIFITAVLLLFAVSAIVFAQTTSATTVTISAGGVSGELATTKSLATVGTAIKLKHATGDSAPYTQVGPSWSPVASATGSVTAGDLYAIDTTGYTGDILVTVYLTNGNALSKDYSYMNLQLNVWSGTSGAWIQAPLADASPIGTVYLTLNNGYASFLLNGNKIYDISVDGGSYYCISTSAVGGSLSPTFYVEVKQA